jgi:hypothetical protein
MPPPPPPMSNQQALGLGTMGSMSSIIGDITGGDQMETTQTMATLGAGYHQCRVARRGRVSKEAFDVSVEGAGSKHKIKPDHLSGFDCQFENAIEGCFIATHNNQNSKQNISSTFDPRDLTCVTCKSAHPIVETRGGGICPLLSSSLTKPSRPWLRGGWGETA